MTDYTDFVTTKLRAVPPVGITRQIDLIDGLFPHQIDLVRWALRRGRAAIFADTGLGKTRMQVAWADVVQRETGGDLLILAPLAVAQQTVAEAAACGVTITHAHDASEIRPGINITNYDRLHKFDAARFVGVVLDESSVIKHHTSKTLQALLDAFSRTPYRLCATATPAPNDWTELGTHAEFLGIRSRAEMLAEFFVHDGGDTQTWRVKGHARQIFWRWVASWGVMLRSPADLGHDASAYNLPPLHVHQHTVESEHDQAETGFLFAMEATDLMERRNARRNSLSARVEACVLHIKCENTKLAAYRKEPEYALEARVRSTEEVESAARSGIQGKAECAINEGQRCAQGIHEGVLRGESGQVQEAHTRETSGVQRKAAGKVRNGCKPSRTKESRSESVGEEQSREKEESETASEIRDRNIGLSGHACNSERCLCNLRSFGHERSELLPSCGPLPQDREDSGAAVHELQSGAWKIQGRHESPVLCNSVPNEKWLIWCDLNDEQDALEDALRREGISFVSIRGSTDNDKRIEYERAWRTGEPQVLISKSSIFGWGLNWQHCAHVAFVGVTDSWESYYQAVRRCYRFGQKREVHVHIFASEQEGSVVANLKRKEADAKAMGDALASEVIDSVRDELMGQGRESNDYTPRKAMNLPNFLRQA